MTEAAFTESGTSRGRIGHHQQRRYRAMEYTKIAYEDRLRLRSHSFEILKRFEFKYTPVGFKFLNAQSDLKGPFGQ
jgi:hypothetical protein